MTNGHKAAVFAACCAEAALLAGILFGHHRYLDDELGVHRSVREICLALWVVLVPAWFTLEAWIFAPKPDDAEAVAAFARGQEIGRWVATVLGAAVATIIGTAAPASTGISPTTPASGAVQR